MWKPKANEYHTGLIYGCGRQQWNILAPHFCEGILPVTVYLTKDQWYGKRYDPVAIIGSHYTTIIPYDIRLLVNSRLTASASRLFMMQKRNSVRFNARVSFGWILLCNCIPVATSKASKDTHTAVAFVNSTLPKLTFKIQHIGNKITRSSFLLHTLRVFTAKINCNIAVTTYDV